MAGIEGVKILFSGDKLLELNGTSNINFPIESGKLVFVNISIKDETACRCFQAIDGGATTFQSGDALFNIIFVLNEVVINNINWTPIHIKSVAVL